MVIKADINTQFYRALRCLHAPLWRKVFCVGPKRFAVRKWARSLGLRLEREAELFFGGSMTVVLPEVISEQLYTYGLFDEIVTGMVLRVVRQGDIVIDVGAHFGYFTLLCAHLVGESGRLVSFEPTPLTFSVLRKNTADVKHVSALNAAAGRQSGRQRISDFGVTYSAWNTLSGSSRMPGVLAEPKARVEVEVICLDDWCERESVWPDVIKIDAENFEAEVIGGLAETLSRCRPRVLMETGSEQAIQAGHALLALDYHVLVSNQPGVLTLQENGVETALVEYKDVLFVPAEDVGEFVRSA